MKVLLTPTPLIAIELPETASKYKISQENDNEIIVLHDSGVTCTQFKDVNFESILGTVDKGVIDFDCEPYLKCFETHGEDREYTYQYIKEGFIHHTCSKNKAFIDLLESHSLSLDKKYLIIKPKN
jgi:hypothetical protein